MLAAMETGAHSAWRPELLEQRGFQVAVGDARKLAAIWMNKNKSDRESAATAAGSTKLCELLQHPQAAFGDKVLHSR